jgi:hypothetical protein
MHAPPSAPQSGARSAASNEATLPFCSPRCRDVDLNRWLSGSYVILARDDEEAEE